MKFKKIIKSNFNPEYIDLYLIYLCNVILMLFKNRVYFEKNGSGFYILGSILLYFIYNITFYLFNGMMIQKKLDNVFISEYDDYNKEKEVIKNEQKGRIEKLSFEISQNIFKVFLVFDFINIFVHKSSILYYPLTLLLSLSPSGN
jgi:hypothetical protein